MGDGAWVGMSAQYVSAGTDMATVVVQVFGRRRFLLLGGVCCQVGESCGDGHAVGCAFGNYI